MITVLLSCCNPTLVLLQACALHRMLSALLAGRKCLLPNPSQPWTPNLRVKLKGSFMTDNNNATLEPT